jgi:hypothetical protein
MRVSEARFTLRLPMRLLNTLNDIAGHEAQTTSGCMRRLLAIAAARELNRRRADLNGKG